MYASLFVYVMIIHRPPRIKLVSIDYAKIFVHSHVSMIIRIQNLFKMNNFFFHFSISLQTCSKSFDKSFFFLLNLLIFSILLIFNKMATINVINLLLLIATFGVTVANAHLSDLVKEFQFIKCNSRSNEFNFRWVWISLLEWWIKSYIR